MNDVVSFLLAGILMSWYVPEYIVAVSVAWFEVVLLGIWRVPCFFGLASCASICLFWILSDSACFLMSLA